MFKSLCYRCIILAPTTIEFAVDAKYADMFSQDMVTFWVLYKCETFGFYGD